MKKTLNWVPIFGKPKISKEKIEYIPSVFEDGPNKGQYDICIVKSDKWFDSGTISFAVTIADPKSGAQVVLNHGHPIEIFIGIGAGGAYGIQTWSNNRFESLMTAGGVFPAPSKYNIQVHIIGSRIRLLVNGVSVCTAISNVSKCQPAFFMRGENKINIENIKIDANPIKAFIFMK